MKQKRQIIKWVSYALLLIGVSGFSVRFAVAVNGDRDFEAQNNIIFYDDCPWNGSSSSAEMTSSFKVDSSVNPWYPEGDLVHTYYSGLGNGKGLCYWEGCSWNTPAPGNTELIYSTQSDPDFGYMQYVYAEQYDVTWSGGAPIFTRNNSNSQVKYYWLALPDSVYNAAVGEQYLATFENISEPVHFIVVDTHACKDQIICEQASADPENYVGGEGLLGAYYEDGHYNEIPALTGGLTGLHRIKGDSKIILSEYPISGASVGSGISSSINQSEVGDLFDENGLLTSIDGATVEYDLVKDMHDDGYKIDPSSYDNVANEYLDYVTSDGNTPQFIILHTTEGSTVYGSPSYPGYNYCRDQGMEYVCAPHFTVDLFDGVIYQHYPIDHPSAAVASTSSPNSTASGDWDKWAVQLEIVGCSQEDTIDSDCGGKSVKNLSKQQWEILAQLLSTISARTGINLSSTTEWSAEAEGYHLPKEEIEKYHGVLSHGNLQTNKQDAGPYVWEKVQEALGLVGSDGCGGSTTPEGFEETVLAFAWPDYRGNTIEMMPDWEDAVVNSERYGYYVGGSVHKGIDCNGFVSTLLVASGFDPNYNTKETSRNTTAQLEYMLNGNSGWEVIKQINEPVDTSMLKAGDVALRNGHTFIYVGEISGFNDVWASASLDERAPMAGGGGASYAEGFYIFRKKA